eukprot:936443_1
MTLTVSSTLLFTCILITNPKPNIAQDKLCVNGGSSDYALSLNGEYEWSSWHSILNQSIYCDASINQYIYPEVIQNTYYYIIDNNVSNHYVTAYCNLGDYHISREYNIHHCLDQWHIHKNENTKHCQLLHDINCLNQFEYDTDIIAVNCQQVCVSGSFHDFLNGEYLFHHFNSSRNSSVYKCRSCNSWSGAFLQIARYTDDYYWVVSPSYPSNSLWSYCHLGSDDALSSNYIADIENLEMQCVGNWYSWNGDLNDWAEDDTIVGRCYPTLSPTKAPTLQPTQNPTRNITYYAYVSSQGDINEHCLSDNPCATFQVVLENMNKGTINAQEVIITISGSNPQYAQPLSDSYCRTEITRDVTFILDETSIHTTEDWFYGAATCQLNTTRYLCCDALVLGPWPRYALFTLSESALVKFYGLIWDVETTRINVFQSLGNAEFYCERCIVTNLKTFLQTDSLLLFSNIATFYNSTFQDIHLEVPLYEVYLTIFGVKAWRRSGDNNIYEDSHQRLNISHCSFVNISGTYVIKIGARLDYTKSINIEYSTVDTVYRFINITSDLIFSNALNSINIESSTFIDKSSDDDPPGFVLLYVGESVLCNIGIRNVNVSYSQYLVTHFLDRSTSGATYQENIVIAIASADATTEITNMMIKTQMHCTVDTFSPGSGRRLSARYVVRADFPYCNVPLPFLLNNGIATIQNVSLQSNYDWYKWKNYFVNNTLFSNGGIYYLRWLYYDITIKDENEPYFASIFNDKNGIITINNLYVDIGSHYSILYNLGGVITIDNLYCQFPGTQSSYYNRWSLRFHTGITTVYGTLTITNSVLKGTDAVLINIFGGDVSIAHSILSQSMMAIISYYSANIIYLDSVKVHEVGKYYATLGAAFYFSHWQYNYNSILDSKYYNIPAVYLSAKMVSISHSHFNYIGPFGIFSIANYGIYDIH